MSDGYSKVLADGVLDRMRQTLYACPARTRVRIELMTLANTQPVDVRLSLYLKLSGPCRLVSPKDMLLKAGEMIEIDNPLNLEQYQSIQASADHENTVDWTLHGTIFK